MKGIYLSIVPVEDVIQKKKKKDGRGHFQGILEVGECWQKQEKRKEQQA